MNLEPYTPPPELWDLCSAAVEDRLTPDQLARLEALVLSDPHARTFYTEYLGVHAALAWSATDPNTLAPKALPSPRPAAPPRSWLRRASWVLAASVVVGLAAFGTSRLTATPAVATLASAAGCKWESGTLATMEGARLPVGRLRLAEGVARITFDTGAEVRIEGPADLELVAADRCVLHAGKLVAKVPPPAIGFKVDTPAAELTDFGTEFGVNVRDGQTSDVQVFEGVVDGRPRGVAAARRMTTGQNLRFGRFGATKFDPHAETPPEVPAAPPGTDALTLSTASDRGKDAYVYLIDTVPAHHSDVLVLVKNSVPAPGTNGKPGTGQPYNRKGYLGIDLRQLAGRKVLDASLTFALTATGIGFASECPDATFAVYGLTDEKLDSWTEKGIKWTNAPANRTGGADLDPAKVALLGRFSVPQGVYTGTRSIGGRELAEFLNRDTNGTATFILVRETVGSGRHDYVHGFPNRRHPTLPPPTLKLTVERK